MTYHAMMFFWALSEKHWLLKPFELIGDFLEDWGLDHGYITFNTLKHCRLAGEEE